MLSTVYGHDKATKYLDKVVESGQLPSVLLFYGMDGVGKLHTAFQLSRQLNCTGEQQPSCTCPSCYKIQRRDHPDVLLYEPENNTFSIDQVRTILEESNRARLEGKWRIFILNGAQHLTPQGADALLKTLEDGRPNVVFVLITNRIDTVIPTLVGRSLDFYFAGLNEKDLRKALDDHKHHRRFDLSLSLSGGSVSEALFYLQGRGFEIRDTALELLRGYPSIPDYKVFSAVDEFEDDENIARLLSSVYTLLIDTCLAQKGLAGEMSNHDLVNILETLAGRFSVRAFEGCKLIKNAYDRRFEPVAYKHQAKSALITLKDVLRE